MARIKCECGREQIVPDGKAKKCRKCGAMLSTISAKTAKREKLSADELQERYPKLVSELTKAAVEATARKLTAADDGAELTADDLKEFFPEAFAEAEPDPKAISDIAATAVKSILDKAGISLPKNIDEIPSTSDDLEDVFLRVIKDHMDAATSKAVGDYSTSITKMDPQAFTAAFPKVAKQVTKAAKKQG